jgi:hypothetical protein
MQALKSPLPVSHFHRLSVPTSRLITGLCNFHGTFAVLSGYGRLGAVAHCADK